MITLVVGVAQLAILFLRFARWLSGRVVCDGCARTLRRDERGHYDSAYPRRVICDRCHRELLRRFYR